jgi:uncharacterized protein
MRQIEGKWVLSPRDLIAELECDHRLNLEWSAATGLLEKPVEENDAGLQLIIDNGRAHEERLVEKHKSISNLVQIPDPGADIEKIKRAHQETFSAIQQGTDVIHQAVLFTGDFLGYADFLIQVKDQSGRPIKDANNRFVYEPVDAKSARVAKRAAVLQVASYARAMVRLDMAMPPKVRLWLAGDAEWEASTADLIDLAEEFETRARSRIESFAAVNNPNWAAPREACTRCRWKEHCAIGRVNGRDLSLIYGIRSTTRTSLIDGGIKTIEDMSKATDDQRKSLKKTVSKETFEKLREQARIQIEGEGAEPPSYEFKDASILRLIPASSDGDIWFDMEGDPYSEGGEGLEYMFGVILKENNDLVFKTFDAENRAQEKRAFSDFISLVLRQRAQYPSMHIYHYAHYESDRMRKLAQRHGVFEKEIDELLRQGVLIDLYAITRQALRFSTDSVSIKSIEKIFFPGHRDNEVTNAMDSVVQFNQAFLQLINGDRASFEKIISEIRQYNEVDCRSLHALDQWLRERAHEEGIILEERSHQSLDDSESENDNSTPEETVLLEGLPEERTERNSEQEGRALLSASISYHRREGKPEWWGIFDSAKKEIDELERDESVTVAESATATTWDRQGRQLSERREVTITAETGDDLRFIFDMKSKPHLLYESSHEKRTNVAGYERSIIATEVALIEEDKVVLIEKCSTKDLVWYETPIALLPGQPISGEPISKIIRSELAGQVIQNLESKQDLFPQTAWADILLRRMPRQKNGTLPRGSEHSDEITKALIDSDSSYVAVQGPPGTGKTHVGAHVIEYLVREKGWRVAVVAQSHPVVENLLNAVLKINPNLPVAKECKDGPNRPSYHVTKEALPTFVSNSQFGCLIGGTAWTYSRGALRSLEFDLMVVEEAGQFALANTIAAVSIAKRALLLGDPQQLPQVSKATHIEPVNKSSLEHLLGEHKTMPDEMGYFLEKTYRLHPLLAKPVSRLQYEGRLIADARCSSRSLESIDPGLKIIKIEHSGNSVRSIEEAEEIVQRIPGLLGKNWMDTDKSGNTVAPRPLQESDILIVTAYNSQVKYLKHLMQINGWTKIRVGTFDKFQGQEAPVVFVSMAASDSEEVSRGMEFLLSPNRLNVAVSRAQWVCYLIRSNKLSYMQPSTPDGMVMLGKFVTLCRELN